MKKMYRNCNLRDLYDIFKTGCVQPKEWIGSEDSTVPAGGEKSFWFDVPAHFDETVAVVEAAFEPCGEGVMEIGWDKLVWDEYEYTIGRIKEFYSTRPVTVEVVAVSWPSHVVSAKSEEEMSVCESRLYKRDIADRERRMDRLRYELDCPEDWEAFVVWVESKKKYVLLSQINEVASVEWKDVRDLVEIVPDED